MVDYSNIRVCNIFNTPAHYCKSIFVLMDKTFDCKFVFGDDFPSVKKFDASILKSSEFVHYRYIKRILFIPGVIKYAFKKYDYYIINPSTNCVTMWVFFLILKLFPSKKIFTWTHGMYGNESCRQRFFKKIQYYLSDGEFIYGDYAIDLMKNAGYNENKLFPIHNSLDYNSQKALRSTANSKSIYYDHFGNNDPVLLMIGRLNKRKRLPMLLDAVLILEEKGVHVNVVFVGEGEEGDNLRRLANKKNISDRIWLYGACYDERSNAELIYNAELCVMPGDIGLTAIHALTFGLPVITHNYFPSHGPEFEVIKPGVTGDFFENGSVESLADKISNWLNHANDRQAIRENCYSVIDKEWTPEYQINIIKAALK